LFLEDAIKGWEFGGGVRMACANVDNMFYAIQGDCPRCAFDLWKGDLLTDNEVWDNAPCIACPTCSTTFSLRTGAYGPPLKRSGLAGFVSGLTATSTNAGAYKNAKAFCISLDADGRVYCRDL
jgi:nitrite reductase/ring-hydroxylating ferredoxin subunit